MKPLQRTRKAKQGRWILIAYEFKDNGTFLEMLAELPVTIRKQAKEAYKQFLEDPYYPSLHFKQVHSTRPVFSVRITKDYRSVGIIQGKDIIWFWIGTHSKYNKILKQLKHT